MDGTRSALIVAADQYTDPGLRRLRAPSSDARALAAVLRDPGIGDFEVRTLLNEPAHVVNLAVEEFFADRRPGDLLLVHFSGHGIKDEDGELYFAAANTVLGRLGATAVAAEFVSRRMNRSRSRRVVLLLDCCYAGAFERGLVARAGVEMGIEQQFSGRGRAVITASSAMEYAFEAGQLADIREVQPSVFTSALVQGLETGEADRDQDGLVGLDELYDYVHDKVQAATPNQTPGKWTFGMEGQLYIARRSRPVTTPAPLPAELLQAIDSPLAGVRAGAVQELARILRGSHAGMALAARLALEQLTDDDSRAVAAAATAALGAPAPVPPESALPGLMLSDTVIDLGRLSQHGRSPEHVVRISNTGSGDLNARAATSAAWLKLRQAGDELMVAVDTSTPGEYEDTITVDSDGGTATIRVHAYVDPAIAAARPGPQQTPALVTPPPTADAVPPVREAVSSSAKSATGQPAAEPDVGPSALPGDGEQHATPRPRDDYPRVTTGGPEPGPGKATPQRPATTAPAGAARSPSPSPGSGGGVQPTRRPRRRVVIALAGAVLAVAAIVASLLASPQSSQRSGSSSSSTSPSAAPVLGMSPAPGNALSGSIVWSATPTTTAPSADSRTVLIDAFEKKYPNIHVTLVSAPANTDTNRATLATQISDGSSTPDVFMGDVIWPAQFGAYQLAVPLSDYLPSSYWAQFAPGLVAGATYDGKVYGSPLFEDQGFMYYRKDLLAKEGMSPPTTWEQLESDATTLVSKGLVKYGFVWQGDSYEGLTCNFMEYLTDAGGTVTNSGYTKATLDSPQALKALTFMRSLITSGASPAAVTTFQEPQAMSTFAAGNAAFMRNWDYAYASANTPATSSVVGKVGVEPMPTFAGQPTPGYSNIGGWNMYINPHSKNIAADLTFIKFLASPQAQTILATQFSEIPVTTVVRSSPTVIALNPVLAIVNKTKLVPRPAGTPNYPALSTTIYTNVNAALAGSASPSAALSVAQSQATTALTSPASGQ